MKRYLFVAALFCALTLVSLCGCKRAEEKAVEQSVPKAATKVEQVAEKAATVVSGGGEEVSKAVATAAAETEELTFEETADLSSLKSYRLKDVITFREDDGKVSVITLESERTTDPPAERLLLTNKETLPGKPEATSEVEIVRIGSENYVRSGDKEWVAMQVPADELLPAASLTYRPGNILRSARGRYVGQETVNGEPTKHYIFTSEALAATGVLDSLVEASGEMWVSTRYNVAVRSVAHLKGRDKDSGKQVTLDIRSDVTDIGREIAIKPPEGVEKPETPADVPIMAGATDLVVVMSMTSYKVEATVEAVKSFYEKEMPKNGWKSVPAKIPGFQQFEKDKRVAQITVQAQGSKTGVAIVITER